eukprot:Skav215921  [mRNA]  locus=scaffold226:210937:213684:+ [translate_table: standard]
MAMAAGFNARVCAEPQWQRELYKAHVAHRELRRELVAKANPEDGRAGRTQRGGHAQDMALVRETMGNSTVDLVMNTGVASMRFDANCSDVKCLHAQVLEDLAAAGVEIEGSEHCCDHCNVNLPLSDARWTLQLAKNKLGQRLRRARRREAS